VLAHDTDTAAISDAHRASADLQRMTGADLIPIMQKGRKLGLKLKSAPLSLKADPPIDLSGSD
jgi:hypothetical protein